MFQRFVVLSVGIILCLCAASYGEAITLTIDPDNFTSTIGTGFGGEFTVTDFSRPDLIPSQGPNVNVGGGVFQNFCVSNDDLIFGDVYDWSLSKTVVTDFPGRSSHPLADQTAYLFTQFWNGTLSNYDYTPGTGRVESAMALQLVLWEFEDALFPGDPFPTQSQAWFDEANSAVAVGGSWFGMGTGEVYVLNLSQGSVVAQAVLTVVPEPASLTLGLIGLGTVVSVLRRRKALL